MMMRMAATTASNGGGTMTTAAAKGRRVVVHKERARQREGEEEEDSSDEEEDSEMDGQGGSHGGEDDPHAAAEFMVKALINLQEPLPVVSRRAMYLTVKMLLKAFSPVTPHHQDQGVSPLPWTVAAAETGWRLLGLQRNSTTLMISEIEEAAKRLALVPQRLLYRFMDAGLEHKPPSQEGEPGIDIGGTPMQALTRVHDMLFEYTRLVAAEYRLSRLAANDAAARSTETLDFTRFTVAGSSNTSEPSSAQQLLLYMYRVLRQQGLRKRKADCYEEVLVTTPSGIRRGTKYWARKDSIRSFLTKTITRENAYDQWYMMTSGAGDMTGQKIVETLETMVDHEFPEVIPSRYLIATRDGLYHTWSQTFISWPELDRGTDYLVNAMSTRGAFALRRELEAGVAITEDMRRRKAAFLHEDARRLRADLNGRTACNFIDQSVDPAWFEGAPSDMDIYSRVQTPAFEQVLRYQKLGRRQAGGPPLTEEEEREDAEEEERVIFWIYALVGRLLYDLKARDNWDIMPYIKGYAGTGKSSIISAILEFFQAPDIGVVSNNIEVPFGLKTIYDTYLWVAPEIRKDFRLPQAIFQSMITGERVVVAVKFKDAISLDWKVPGIACGNELPRYQDASGSFIRRVALILFEMAVGRGDGDPELVKRMRAETLALMIKANAAARHVMATMGHREIWSVLPKYFWKSRQSMQEQSNTLIGFIRSGDVMEIQNTTADVAAGGDVRMGEAGNEVIYSVTKATFEREYVDWCKKSGRVAINMSDQHQVTAALSAEGLRIVREERTTGAGGNRMTTEFIYGIRKRDISVMDLDGGGGGAGAGGGGGAHFPFS